MSKKPGPRPRKGPKCLNKSLSIREDLWKAIDKEARLLGVSTSSLICQAVAAYLKLGVTSEDTPLK